MQTNIIKYTLFSILLLLTSSCTVVGDIFKAGVWVGVLAIVGIIALIIFIMGKASGGR